MALTKIKISGVIIVKTGLHIGGDDSFSAIGAIDSPVIRDPYTHLPIIPGSTLKGKMRSLLARDLGVVPAKGNAGYAKDPDSIKRLFGVSAGEATSDNRPPVTRLQFSDCFLRNKNDLPQITEVKNENAIDRLSCVATPRKIERVIRGAQFDFEMIYNMDDYDQLEEDFALIAKGLKLIENDYLGGGGTRGNGRVTFSDVEAEVVTGDTGITIPALQ